MSSYRKAVTIGAAAVLAVCAVISLWAWKRPACSTGCVALILLTVWGTYAGTGKHSLIALSVSLIPAAALWIFFLDTSPGSIILCIVSLATILLVSRRAELPEVRESTDKWVGTLLTCEILLFTALSVFCGLF